MKPGSSWLGWLRSRSTLGAGEGLSCSRGMGCQLWAGAEINLSCFLGLTVAARPAWGMRLPAQLGAAFGACINHALPSASISGCWEMAGMGMRGNLPRGETEAGAVLLGRGQLRCCRYLLLEAINNVCSCWFRNQWPEGRAAGVQCLGL